MAKPQVKRGKELVSDWKGLISSSRSVSPGPQTLPQGTLHWVQCKLLALHYSIARHQHLITDEFSWVRAGSGILEEENKIDRSSKGCYRKGCSPRITRMLLLTEIQGSVRRPRMLLRSVEHGCFMDVRPVHLYMTPTLKGPMLGLICCHCLEILNNFWQEVYFHFAVGPTNYVYSPATRPLGLQRMDYLCVSCGSAQWCLLFPDTWLLERHCLNTIT